MQVLKILLSVVAMLMPGRLYAGFFSMGDEKPSTASDTVNDGAPENAMAPKVDKDDLSLKQSRLMNRMDEIETELLRQREQIKLLERGLLTGIPPEGLKSNVNSLNKPLIDDNAALPRGTKNDRRTGESPGASELKSRMQVAKEHFQEARFGIAISDLAAISRDFGENAADGEVHVWLGKSYLELKEFPTARSELEIYLKKWPSGDLVGRARLELAKCYVGLGLKERARSEFKKVIKDFPDQDVAEIATLEMKRLQSHL